jgi:hypothetical protein
VLFEALVKMLEHKKNKKFYPQHWSQSYDRELQTPAL